jgi:Zn-dependent protease with chaperone function
MADRIKLTGLQVDDFVAQGDKFALDKLKKLPLLPQAIEKFYEVGIDRWLYCMNMSMSVRCGPRQYSSLHSMLREAFEILDMAEPELYVANNPFPNAWAGGVERPYITIRSSLVDTLSDEQLLHLIGHELGHIKADHVLYFSVGQVLMPLLEMLGRRTLGLGDVATYGLVLAYYEWMRQAEFTADRAGLLVSQDLETSLMANLALTAGPSRLREEQSLDAFREQAQAYQDAGPLDQMGKVVVFLLMGHSYTHPMPVHRAQHLERWAKSGDYEALLSKFKVGV